MIAGTYLGSAAAAVVIAVLCRGGSLTEWSFIAILVLTVFPRFRRAGARLV